MDSMLNLRKQGRCELYCFQLEDVRLQPPCSRDALEVIRGRVAVVALSPARGVVRAPCPATKLDMRDAERRCNLSKAAVRHPPRRHTSTRHGLAPGLRSVCTPLYLAGGLDMSNGPGNDRSEPACNPVDGPGARVEPDLGGAPVDRALRTIESAELRAAPATADAAEPVVVEEVARGRVRRAAHPATAAGDSTHPAPARAARRASRSRAARVIAPQLATLLRAAAKKGGWTQAALARTTGVSEVFMGHLFHGKRRPGWAVARALAAALAITAAEIMEAAHAAP